MKIVNPTFKGKAPRYAPRMLPSGMAQTANCPRLLSGDLEAWQDNQLQFALAKKGNPYVDIINTIFPMDIDVSDGGPFWLHWKDSELGTGAVEIDVAKGPIVGDTTERIYITGLDQPRYTTLYLATDPVNQGVNLAGAYPYITLPLGFDGPTTPPIAIVTGTTETETGIEVPNGDAELGSTGGVIVTGTVSVYTNAAGASPSPEGIAPFEGTYMFGGNAAAEAIGTASTGEILMDLQAAGVQGGQIIRVNWQQISDSSLAFATVGLKQYDGTGAVLVPVSYEPESQVATWTGRSLERTLDPDAKSIGIVMYFENADGTHTGAYIDATTLTVQGASYVADGSSSALSDWTQVSSNQANAYIQVSADEASANFQYSAPPFQYPIWRFRAYKNATISLIRDFGSNNVQSGTLNFDYKYRHIDEDDGVNMHVLLFADEAGNGQSIGMHHNNIWYANNTSWLPTPVVIQELPGSANGLYVNFRLDFVRKPGDRADVTYTLTNKSTGAVIVTATIELLITGSFIGLKGTHGSNNYIGDGYMDNLSITLSAPLTVGGGTDVDDVSLAANYVFTFINSADEESAPSPVSNTVYRPDGITVTVTTATTSPDASIEGKRIYRSATGASGSVYLLVNTEGDIPLAQAEYEDTKTDAELGEPLSSSDFDPPPDGARGIIACANGITYVFEGNTLCPSEQNRPHAYPVRYRLATDYPIVAIGTIDTDVVLATQANPYIVTGDDPGTLAMAKLEKPQGCVSKRSMVSISGMGVVYASPDGLTAVSRGGVNVITESFISRKEWQALSPETIHAVEHDGRYVAFYNGVGGFIIDPNPNGFGFIDLDFYASAAFSNPLTDELFLVIGGSLYIWDGSASKRPYLWKSKQFQVPRPVNFAAGDVTIVSGSGTVTLKMYADGTLFFTKSITASGEFVCPGPDTAPGAVVDTYLEVSLEGTGSVKDFRFAESMDELQS